MTAGLRHIVNRNNMKCIDRADDIVFAEHSDHVSTHHDELWMRDANAASVGQTDCEWPKPVAHALPNVFQVHLSYISFDHLLCKGWPPLKLLSARVCHC
jgi:hypothetical protein